MNKHFAPPLGVTITLLLLALNGCASGANTSPGTSTSGSISISTDHSTYASTDAIHVTVTNHSSTSIFAYDTNASCSILGLQMQINGIWQPTQVAGCSLGRPPMIVEIPAGQVYTATIRAGAPGVSQAQFPSGTYRLTLTYSTSATRLPPQLQGNTTTIFSASLSVTT